MPKLADVVREFPIPPTISIGGSQTEPSLLGIFHLRPMLILALQLMLLVQIALSPVHSPETGRVSIPSYQQAASSNPYITLYDIQGNTTYRPLVLQPATDGTVWVLAAGGNTEKIVHLDPVSGTRTYLTINSQLVLPQDITLDRSGKIWFPNPPNSSLVRLDPVVNRTMEIPLPVNSFPGYLTVDRQNTVWVTLIRTNQIAHYDPNSNTTQLFPVPTPQGTPYGIASAPDGTVWFTETLARKLARLDPNTSKITEYSSPLKLVGPVFLALDDNGVVWFTDHGSNEFGSFNQATNQWVKYPTGYCNCSFILPNAIGLDAHQKVWFSEHFAGRVARYDPAVNLLTEYSVPVPPGTPSYRLPFIWWVQPGVGNQVWFAAFGLGEVGYVNTQIAIPFTLTAKHEITIPRGSSASLGATVSSRQGFGTIDLGISASSLEQSENYSQVKGSFAPSHITVDATSKTISGTISVAPNATIGVHYVTVTAADGQVSLGIPIKITVTEGSPAQRQLSSLLDVKTALVAMLGTGAAGLGFFLLLKRVRTKNSGPPKTELSE